MGTHASHMQIIGILFIYNIEMCLANNFASTLNVAITPAKPIHGANPSPSEIILNLID